jgi:hypothetical protein
MGNISSYLEAKEKEKKEKRKEEYLKRWSEITSDLSVNQKSIIDNNFTDDSRALFLTTMMNKNNYQNINNGNYILQFVESLNLKKNEKVLLERAPHFSTSLHPRPVRSTMYYVINLNIPSRNIISKTYLMKY